MTDIDDAYDTYCDVVADEVFANITSTLLHDTWLVLSGQRNVDHLVCGFSCKLAFMNRSSSAR